MKCPKCEKEMRPKNYGDVEVDKCPECSGFFFDQGELETLMAGGAEGVKEIEYSELSNKQDMMIGSCPRCNVDMEPYLGPGNLRIDRCTKCSGVFLDQGEFEELVAT